MSGLPRPSLGHTLHCHSGFQHTSSWPFPCSKPPLPILVCCPRASGGPGLQGCPRDKRLWGHRLSYSDRTGPSKGMCLWREKSVNPKALLRGRKKQIGSPVGLDHKWAQDEPRPCDPHRAPSWCCFETRQATKLLKQMQLRPYPLQKTAPT